MSSGTGIDRPWPIGSLSSFAMEVLLEHGLAHFVYGCFPEAAGVARFPNQHGGNSSRVVLPASNCWHELCSQNYSDAPLSLTSTGLPPSRWMGCSLRSPSPLQFPRTPPQLSGTTCLASHVTLLPPCFSWLECRWCGGPLPRLGWNKDKQEKGKASHCERGHKFKSCLSFWKDS